MKLRTLLVGLVASLLTAVVVSQAQVPGVNSTLNSVFTLAYDNSTMKPTYSAASGFTSPAGSGGSDICSLYGSATKTVKVRRVIFGAVAAALQTDPISIIKRSTISNGGTVSSSAAVVTAYDSSNTASTAITDIYTTSPTSLGTLVGVLADRYVTINGATTAVAPTPMTEFVFGALGQPVVLRGVSQSINVNGNALASVSAVCVFEWTEE